jgi:hypothetical protein
MLSNIRYLSVVSGSSWAAVPLAFLPDGYADKDSTCADTESTAGPPSSNEEAFLGSYLPPEECSLAAVQSFAPHSHSDAIARANFALKLLENAIENIPEATAAALIPLHHRRGRQGRRGRDGSGIEDFWSEAVAEAFFEKYGINNRGRVPILREILTSTLQQEAVTNSERQRESGGKHQDGREVLATTLQQEEFTRGKCQDASENDYRASELALAAMSSSTSTAASKVSPYRSSIILNPDPQNLLTKSPNERTSATGGLDDTNRFDVCQPLSKFPFLIVNASVEVGGAAGFIPLEFTPLYNGKLSLMQILMINYLYLR